MATGLPVSASASSSARAQDAALSLPATVFTLAGVGSAAPREGAAATDVRIGGPALAGLPDGSVGTVDERNRPLLIGTDGRIHLLPPFPDKEGVHRLAAEPGGALLAVALHPLTVWRRLPGAAGWQRAFDLRRIPGWKPDFESFVDGLAVLTGGGIAVSGSEGVWRLSADGGVQRVPIPASDAPFPSAAALTALPDGTLVFTYGGSDTIAFVAPDGRTRTVPGVSDAGRLVGLASLPDGRVLRAEGMLEVLDPDGAAAALAGDRPALSVGDGGPPSNAFLAGSAVTVAGDRAIVIGEWTPFGAPETPFDLPAVSNRDGNDLDDPFDLFHEHSVLRILTPVTTARPLAAITPATFSALRRGRASYTSTIAGRATLTLRRDGRTAARIEQTVAAGPGEFRVPRRMLGGNVRMSLTVESTDGRRATAHLVAATDHTLARARALEIIRRIVGSRNDGDGGGGYFTDVGRCRRGSARRVDCQAIETTYEGATRRRACAGVISARLRHDGVRVADQRSRRACRRLGSTV